jgi:hypothetical protein
MRGSPKCLICGYPHESDSPHNAESMQYQSWFLREHGRLPTWEDAMAHCPDDVKQLARVGMRAYGINPKATADMTWHAGL